MTSEEAGDVGSRGRSACLRRSGRAARSAKCRWWIPVSALVVLASCGDASSQERTSSAMSPQVTSTSTTAPPESSGDVEESITEDTTSTVAASSTAPPTAPRPPTSVLDVATGEPFRYSFERIADVPELPSSVDGWMLYSGPDAGGFSGRVRRSEVRAFQGAPGVSVIDGFSAQMNDCGDAIWIARWAVGDPDVTVVATNEVAGVGVDPSSIELEPWMLPPPGRGGIMSGSVCQQPGFAFADTLNGNQSNLVDITIEWSYFDRDPFAQGDASDDPQATTCSDFVYNDSLPILVCSQGYSVSLVQQALGVEADGYFGPGTESAVRDFQASVGLEATGVIDATTWAELGVNAGAPYPDLNGDGVIDGSEVPMT